MLNKRLEPVKVDIKRTKTKSETARKYSNDKIIILYKSIYNYIRIYNYKEYTIIYEIKRLGSADLNIFLGSVG